MVFGLENLRTRKRSTVVLFLFIILIVGDKPKSGGLLMILASYLNFANMTQLRVSFCCTGISLILFHNVPRSKEFSYIGRKVVQCIFVSALRLFKSPSSKRHWMNASGFRCDRHTENAMKELLILFLMIVPTVGFTFFIMGKWAEGNLWEGIATKAYPSGFYKYTGIVAGLQISIYVSMILSFFALVPLLELVGVKKKFSHQFVAGYLIGLFTFWYMTGLVRIYEPPGSLPGVGNVRIINTLKYDAHFITGDLIVSERNFTIKPLGVIMLSYSVNERVLVKTRLAIHEMNNEFNTFLDIAPKKCSAYVLVDPLELLRIKGSIPIWRGVPDANDHTMARLYVFTAARSIVSDARLIFKCLDTNRVVKKNPLVPGDSFVFEVPPGSYEARLERTHVVQTLDVAPGSVYGLIFYSDYHSERLVVDEVIPGKETPGMLSTGFALGYGISFSLAYISFAYMAFLRAPIGLLTTTFGYLAFQENLSNWILLIGFNTWHEQMTSHVMMMYAFLLSFLFFVCIFVFMKYTNVYSVYISCFH